MTVACIPALTSSPALLTGAVAAACLIMPAGTRGAVAGSQQVFRVNTDCAVPGT